MMWGYYPSWGGMFLMMVLGNILWIVLLGALVWAVIRWLERRARGSGALSSGPSAFELLCQRYARGEIDTATFEQIRERLEATRAQETSTDLDGRRTPIPQR